MSQTLPALNDFSSRIGEVFTLELETASIDLVLVEAASIGQTRSVGERPFSILFHGPGAAELGQGNYALRHAELGAMQLFLVPIGRTEERVSYEAVFN